MKRSGSDVRGPPVLAHLKFDASRAVRNEREARWMTARQVAFLFAMSAAVAAFAVAATTEQLR